MPAGVGDATTLCPNIAMVMPARRPPPVSHWVLLSAEWMLSAPSTAGQPRQVTPTTQAQPIPRPKASSSRTKATLSFYAPRVSISSIFCAKVSSVNGLVTIDMFVPRKPARIAAFSA